VEGKRLQQKQLVVRFVILAVLPENMTFAIVTVLLTRDSTPNWK